MTDIDPQPALPSPKIIEEMARDFASHGKPDFVLERDVSYPGNPQPEANYTYYFSEEEGERYHCPLCGGTSLPKKIPYGTPERNARVRRLHPEIWELARTIEIEDLGNATPEQLIEARRHLEQVTEDFDRGLYAEVERAVVARSKQLKTKEEGRDAAAASRIANAEAWMLERYAQIGNKEEVLGELEALRDSNPELHLKLIGDTRAIPDGTARRWWSQIPAEQRQAAKAAYNKRPAEERKRLAAERRARKVSR